MDPTIQWAVSQTGTAGLAALAIILLDRVHKMVQALTEQYAIANREDKLLLVGILAKNAEAQTTIATKIDSLVGLVTRLEEWFIAKPKA